MPSAPHELPGRSGPRHRTGDARNALAAIGPAFVAAVAYVDPGNIATDTTAGARFGYELIWVVLLANLMAMFVQYLSAKVGIVTGANLAELCRDRYRAPVRLALWVQAEIMIVMTDLAEIIGCALGLLVLFGIPLAAGGVITGVAVLVMIPVQQHGRRAFEVLVTGLLTVVAVCFAYQLTVAHRPAAQLAAGIVPRLNGPASVLLACGIVGATVMPHAVYLHGGLTQGIVGGRKPVRHQGLVRGGWSADRAFALLGTRWDVVSALGLAGLVNVAILAGMSGLGGQGSGSLTAAGQALARAFGELARLSFGTALLTSGLAASLVGLYTGQVVMQGFLHREVPLWLRRLVSLVPAVALLSSGIDISKALIASQVALSFCLPFALIPLLLVTRDRRVMGDFASRRVITLTGTLIVAIITGLNAYLVVAAA